ncbi:hypothetical protein T06_15250 [Trichinella sp. T6]|nr:hypothetical protein T06_7519 [Trichinella sp. T6]KRX78789.1 hypothetical protein T06_15250 [Trichinella sp. T6]
MAPTYGATKRLFLHNCSSESTGTRVSWLLLSCCCTFSMQPGSAVFHMPPDGPSRATSVVFDPRLGVTQPRTDFVQLARFLCFHKNVSLKLAYIRHDMDKLLKSIKANPVSTFIWGPEETDVLSEET